VANDEPRDDGHIAEANTILLVKTGSQAYGLADAANSDMDHKGVFIEPFRVFTGFNPMDSYIYRTAAIREQKHDAPSGPGDLDLTIYGLHKFLRLAMSGNPDVTEMLFIKSYLKKHPLGTGLQAMYPFIISKQSGRRFLGYMEAQKARLMGEIGQKKINRPDLEEQFGYDVKYAYHIIRLAYQGVELLEEGKLTLPFTGEKLGFLSSIRKGEVPIQTVLNCAGQLERKLKDLIKHSPLPEYPDGKAVEKWMLETYWLHWLDAYNTAWRKAGGGLTDGRL
jgi:uncharacterized protein